VPTRYALPEAPPDEYAPVLDFDTFMTYVFDWKQNQHIAVIGPTEQGKTNLVHHLLHRRTYVGYLGIKSRDSTLDAFAKKGGYQRIHDWPPTTGRGPLKRSVTWQEMPKRLIWPDATDRRNARHEQIRVFNAALDDIWASGNATVVWDDFWYIVNILGMEKDAKQNLLNARSANSPQVICAQRGAGNRMVELFDQPTWLFFAKETDPRNLALIGRPNTMEHGFVANLDRYQFLSKNIRTGVMYRTTAPLLEGS
jgi:hypothetical protein